MAKHLTPSERAAIVARYVETANASQVAREFGVNQTTVRKQVARANGLKKNDFHAKACARAVREGRRTLSKTAKRLHDWLEEHGDPAAPTMEPGDVSKMATALRGIISGVIVIDEHRNRSALSRLTRELRRKEIELAKLRIAAGGVERHEHTVVTPADGAALAREVFGSSSALDRKTDGSGATSGDAVAGDVLPVPDPVDH